MEDGGGAFLHHLTYTRTIKEQHMRRNIFPQLFLPQKPFIVELLFGFVVQRSLYLLWRGLIRNGPPVWPKHIQPAQKCMQIPFFFGGGGSFSCVNSIFAGNHAHANAGV